MSIVALASVVSRAWFCDTVITKLDGVMQQLQSHREEDIAGAQQLHRHDDQLLNHERRITALEQQS